LLTQVIAAALRPALYGHEVPRYFFNIFDHAVSLDDEGIELADARPRGGRRCRARAR